jgi:hypothetical protein
MNENGQIVRHGSGPNAYMTDVLSRKANNFIRRAAQAAEKKPFFMYIAAYAPHGPATPAPRHADAFPDAQAPRTRSFNESNVSDKPAWVQTHPRLTASQVAAMDALYRKRLQSMLAVEDLVDSLIRTLENTGELDNTYVFFTSDNGFHQGQHRLNSGKNTAFEEDLRVPLVVRGPGVPAGGNLDHLAANLDLAATFAELAGVAPPEVVDGRSLAPLLTADPPLVGGWRRALLLEHGFPGDAPEVAADDAEGALEPADPFDEAAAAVDEAAAPAPKGVPVFQGLRTAGRVTYIEYSTGERELYRLSTDPDQLANAYGKADPDRLARLASWLDSLRRCAGAECRAAEDGPP